MWLRRSSSTATSRDCEQSVLFDKYGQMITAKGTHVLLGQSRVFLERENVMDGFLDACMERERKTVCVSECERERVSPLPLPVSRCSCVFMNVSVCLRTLLATSNSAWRNLFLRNCDSEDFLAISFSAWSITRVQAAICCFNIGLATDAGVPCGVLPSVLGAVFAYAAVVVPPFCPLASSAATAAPSFAAVATVAGVKAVVDDIATQSHVRAAPLRLVAPSFSLSPRKARNTVATYRKKQVVPKQMSISI